MRPAIPSSTRAPAATSSIHKRGENRLLAILPAAERARALERCVRIPLKEREVLFESGATIGHLYYPIAGVLSVIVTTSDGDSAEVGTIGNEGIAGVSIFLGDERSRGPVLCQVPGEAWRIKAGDFLELAEGSASMRRTLLRYTQALFYQVSQTAACNGLHTVEQRLARWLLMTRDRAGADRFKLTQDFIAQMLAIRRQSVTVAARALQKAGLIRYAHGDIAILDGEALEESSCTCYQAVRREFERLLQP